VPHVHAVADPRDHARRAVRDPRAAGRRAGYDYGADCDERTDRGARAGRNRPVLQSEVPLPALVNERIDHRRQTHPTCEGELSQPAATRRVLAIS